MALQIAREGAQQVKGTEGPNRAAIPSWLRPVLETPAGHDDIPQATSHRCPVHLSSVRKSKGQSAGMRGVAWKAGSMGSLQLYPGPTLCTRVAHTGDQDPAQQGPEGL